MNLQTNRLAALSGTNGVHSSPAPSAAPGGAAATSAPHIVGTPPLLLTCQQAADALAISTRTLWELTKRGEVPCVRLGRAVRYAVQDLSEYVERLRAERGQGGEGSP